MASTSSVRRQAGASTPAGAICDFRDAPSSVFDRVRHRSIELASGLSDADATVQSMPDASPAKWHLAHTTWFFETFVLALRPGYRAFDDRFGYLFNSYYEAAGARHPRPARGLLTRPDLQRVRDYRAHVDDAMQMLLSDGPDGETLDLIELGLHHEQQHQELLLTDILHLFSCNPMRPAFRGGEPLAVPEAPAPELGWVDFDGGRVWIGHEHDDPDAGFAFDCEGPRHERLLRPYRLADRCVTNGEWLEFMADDGYANPALWLSDGWAAVQQHGWRAPMYWEQSDGGWRVMTLRGTQQVDPDAPVCHVSYYEADAFASWAGARLPDEAEWEAAATCAEAPLGPLGEFAGGGRLRPAPAVAGPGLRQMFGDVWEWTRSAYSPYPGFKPAAGAVGEYNGKFMCGQFVLRGGSCATPEGHVRTSYRNFFQPWHRWQFSGLRLAADR